MKASENTKRYLIFLKGLITENPVLVLVLGICPTLAQTKSVESAVWMGIAVTLVLICSNAVISALRKLIPDTVRVPCYIVIIAGFVSVIQMLLQAYLPNVYEMLGTYLALIVVNCIILGRAELYARKHGVIDSILDGAGMGLGFLLALFIMAVIREVLGAGSFWGMEISVLTNYKIPILIEAPGGYLVFGLVIAAVNAINHKRGGVRRRSFHCNECPFASNCSQRAICSDIEPDVKTEEGGNDE